MAGLRTQTVVAVLAGGRGSRLGGNKPSALLAGRPLIHYPLRAARQAGLSAVVIAKSETSLPAFEEPVIFEPDEVHHPLCGLIAALGSSPRILAIGCDMPFITSQLLSWLATRPAPCVVVSGGVAQPFPSVHVDGELPLLREALEAERSLRSTFASLSPFNLAERELAQFGDPALLLSSINSPAQLREAAARLQNPPREVL